MKAYQLKSINHLEYTDVDFPALQKKWCIVKVKTSGICSSDISRIFSKGTYNFPTIPGHEFSGIVEKVACNEDSKWLGKRVSVFPLIPCNKCEQCKNHNYETCENYDYIGSRRDGAFAEYVTVPIWNLLELPKEVSFHEAAMFEPISVSMHAVKRAKVQKLDKVAVIGTGIIGLGSAQCTKLYGVEKVTVIGRNLDKLKLIEDISGLDYRINNFEKYDVVFEAVGSINSITQALDLVKPGGKVILMGNPQGDIFFNQDIYWSILRKQITLIGTWNSSYENVGKSDWYDVCSAIEKKRIEVLPLISHIFNQDELFEGLNLMKEHVQTYCKILIDWND